VRGAAIAAAALAAVCFRTPAGAQEVPFAETFDSRTAGALHGQNQWQAHRQNDAQVQTAVVYAGGKAAAVTTNTTAWRGFSGAATNVWVDFYARVPRPAAGAAPALVGSVAAAFYVAEDGTIRATSNAAWVALNHTVPSNAWHRFTVHLDYAAERWDLYAADDTPNRLSTPVATNIPFSSLSTNTGFRGFRIRN
jgi:hypothetical protein